MWGNSERNALTDVLNNHHIARKVVGVFHDHKTVEEYRRYADILGAANARVNALRAQPPENLSNEDVGEIINQNDRLRTMVTETNGEMVKYRNRSQAQFLPVEIYNDENGSI